VEINIFNRKFNIGPKKEVKNSTVSTLPYIASDGEWLSFLNSKGYAINTDTALKVAVVIRCADVVSKTMAVLAYVYYEFNANIGCIC
jgi:phage portal protein BeeE